MEKKMSKKKIVLLSILAAVILALLVVVIGYMRGWFNKGYDADVVTVSKRNVTATYETSGAVSSSSEGKFTAPAGIKVQKVNVKVGQVVKKGDVLATFDASSLNEALSEKQEALNKAKKAYDDYKSGITTAQGQLAETEKKIAEAESKVAKLEKEAEKAQKEAEKTAAENAQKAKEQAEAAKENLEKITEDKSLSGKIIDSIMKNNPDLQKMKEMLNSVSSMSSGYDLSQLMGSMSGGTSQYELMQAQLELATLKAGKAMSQAQSNGNLESVYKSVYDAALKAYNETQEKIDTLNGGWVAKHDGVVSDVNIKSGKIISADGAKDASTFDAASIVSAAMSGGDVSSLVSGFFSQGGEGITVQYYPLEIKFMLNKGDLGNVHVGQAVDVMSETGETLRGEVTFIAAVATSGSSFDISSLMGGTGGASGGIEAIVSVDKPDSGIIIGMDADISIDVEEKKGCITVPVESIQYDDSHAYVYTYNAQEGTISRKTVETGIFDGTYYEIVSGVKAGEIIVRTPVATMADGDKVIAHNVD
ncbi:MAG: biotin/lipoyl-binding protein [Clostridia bacterium]|nr:biotin/lipoyl-binding protein [Clostridia bacterium]